MGVENASSPLPPQRKLKLLGLHGFRTSGDILKRQLSKWSPSILDLMDLDTLDGPFPCLGKSDVEGYFEGPYYEWFRFNKDYTEFEGVEDAISFISDYMKTHGPYDGLVGFSQGAVLSGLLAGLQEKAMALQDVASIKFVILTSPAQLREKDLKVVYEAPAIKCPAVILLGEKDWLRPMGEEVVESFHEPLVIRHRYGHTVPRLDSETTNTLVNFLKSRLGNDYQEEAALPEEAALREEAALGSEAYAEDVCVAV